MTALTLETAHLTIANDSQSMPLKSATCFGYYIREAVKSVKERRLRICLSGGSTPFALYHLLTQEPWREGIPWEQIDFFMGDERFVPFDDEQSNFGRIRRTLFEHVPLHVSQLHPMPVTGTPQKAARDYEHELKTCYGGEKLSKEKPFFDLTLLGMGEDGHTASLFPHDDARLIEDRWAAPAHAPKAPHQRLTLTFPLINNSRFIMFMINGVAKKNILTKIRHGDKTYPVAQVKALGDMTLITDQQTLATSQ